MNLECRWVSQKLSKSFSNLRKVIGYVITGVTCRGDTSVLNFGHEHRVVKELFGSCSQHYRFFLIDCPKGILKLDLQLRASLPIGGSNQTSQFLLQPIDFFIVRLVLLLRSINLDELTSNRLVVVGL